MDYVVLSTLRNTEYKTLLFSYDIACQWHKHFRSRMANFPEALQLDADGMILRYVVPKFHLPAHGAACQSRFSLNFLPRVGRTYGEGVEQEWSHINGTATSTREMAPSVRRETLDDHWGSWNWQKTIGFGDCVRTRMSYKWY